MCKCQLLLPEERPLNCTLQQNLVYSQLQGKLTIHLQMPQVFFPVRSNMVPPKQSLQMLWPFPHKDTTTTSSQQTNKNNRSLGDGPNTLTRVRET